MTAPAMTLEDATPGEAAVRPVSVLITTYNDVAILRETVVAILDDPATTELVVVVDGARDGSLELLQDIARSDTRLRPIWIENRGRSGAKNLGLTQVTHDIVVLLDADVIAQPGMITGHARWHADKTPRIVLGYMPTEVPARRPGSFVYEQYARSYEATIAVWEDDSGAILRRLWTGNMSCPRRALLDAGGFPEGIDYMEDTHLGLRLRETDLQPHFDRTLRASHRQTRDVRQFAVAARQFGATMALLNHQYPGVLDPPPWLARDRGWEGVFGHLIRRPRANALLQPVVMALVTITGQLRWWRGHARAGILLDRVATMRGMLDARLTSVG